MYGPIVPFHLSAKKPVANNYVRAEQKLASVIAHESLHRQGATDKYNLASN
jgi:hypothetical protein